ncbi:BACON domain-containing protein [Massilia sp. BJB1822]|uniref:BACON domain-containing protein n=1 Tax=Massilia sp. BJB1822 TaxID=2744470 RepID=UPI0015933AE9|nr:hypothetical protein [Massilia sp. BJB1822]NVD98671.1 hypothetical protein [Massilia sp. BJB1822]
MKRLIASLVVGVLASGCGGGGGGSGGGGTSTGPVVTPPPVNSPNLTLSPARVDLSLSEGKTGTFTIKATANKDFPGTSNIGIIDTRGVINPNARVYALDLYNYQAELTTAQNLAPGIYDGVIEIRVCKDNPVSCAQPHEGSPWKLPYHFEVKADLKVGSSAPMSAAVAEASSHDFPLVPITLASGQAALDYEVVYSQGAGWLSALAVNGQLKVTASSNGLAPGSYAATLKLRGLSASNTVVGIPVSITVGAGFSVPAQLALQIDGNTPDTAAGQSITATIAAVRATKWSVSSNQPWLTVDTVNGETGSAGNLRIHIEPAQVHALGNDRTVSATLTVNDLSNAYRAATIPVNVTLKLPELSGTAPFHLFSGNAETVTVYGKNLDRLPLASLRFGGQAAANPTLINAGAISFKAPAIATAGKYSFSAARVAAPLAMPVVDPGGDHVAAFLPVASSNELDQTRRMVFDDARDDLYVSNHNGVAKYHYQSGAWTRSWLNIPDAVYAIALSPDRTTLVAAARNSLHLIDVASFTVTFSQQFSYPDAWPLDAGTGTIAFAPGGNLFMKNSMLAFDLKTRKFVATAQAFMGGTLSANSFGNLLHANSNPDSSTANHDWIRLRAGEQVFSPIKPGFECNTYVVSTSRYGEVSSCDHRFYSATGGQIGLVPYDDNGGWGFSVISPDGRYAYTILPRGQRIVQYGLEGGLRKLGFYTHPKLYNTNWDYGLYGSINDALISQNGRTLFVAMPGGLHIIPVSAMTPVQ